MKSGVGRSFAIISYRFCNEERTSIKEIQLGDLFVSLLWTNGDKIRPNLLDDFGCDKDEDDGRNVYFCQREVTFMK